jgi:hypothetical protein
MVRPASVELATSTCIGAEEMVACVDIGEIFEDTGGIGATGDNDGLLLDGNGSCTDAEGATGAEVSAIAYVAGLRCGKSSEGCLSRERSGWTLDRRRTRGNVSRGSSSTSFGRGMPGEPFLDRSKAAEGVEAITFVAEQE